MKKKHQFDQKMYKVNIHKNDHYFVIAYSEVHAIVELVNILKSMNIQTNAGEYKVENVHEMSKEDMEDIIIDFNYVTESNKQESLLEIFEDLTKFEDNKFDFYGVVGDDFIDYN